MRPYRNWLLKHSTGRKVLLLFIATNIVYLVMLLVTIPKTAAFAGGMKLPDMMPGGYNSGYLIALFEELGEEGRSFYRTRQLPVDMIYPGLFAMSYSLLLAYFFRRIGKSEGPLFGICLMPFIAGAADYGENVLVFILLGDFPHIRVPITAAASVLTIIKSSATTIVFISLLVVLAIYFFRYRRFRGGN